MYKRRNQTDGARARSRSITVLVVGWTCALCCVTTMAAQTNTYYVSPSGSHTSPFDTWTKAATNIQDAANRAGGDLGPGTNCVVLVTNGTYVLTNAITLSQAVTVSSANGRDVTVVDANATAGDPRRVFTLTASGAILDGFTLRGGYTLGIDHPTGDPGGGLYINGATVRNCTIRNNTTTYYGGGVYMNGGRLENCLICSNAIPSTTRTGSSNQPDGGGGVMCESGTIDGCTILKNTGINCANNQNSGGGGVNIRGGRLLNSVVQQNSLANGWGGGGAFVSLDLGGTISNCTFTGNSGSIRATAVQLMKGQMYRCRITNHGGGFAVDTLYATTIRNTLFAKNTGRGIRSWGGGIMDNCTITDNGYGIDRQAGSTLVLRNCIVYGNITADYINSALTLRMTNCCSSTLFAGANNTSDDPQLLDAVALDYQLSAVSPCQNTGTNLSWMTPGTLDLNGNPRVAIGTVDMGAYERQTPPGTMSTNTYYVSLAGANTPPFDTWPKAATDIQTAIDRAETDMDAATASVVIVTNGTYLLTDAVTISKGVPLQSVNGAGATIVDANADTSAPRRVFTINSSSALVDGFTITGGYTLGIDHANGDPGGGVYCNGGTVRNCIVEGNTTTYYGGGAYMIGGLLEDSVVRSNAIPSTTRTGDAVQPDGGGGVFCQGGRIQGCTISLNRGIRAAGASNSGGAGVCLNGGVLNGCTINDNHLASGWGGGGVLVTDAVGSLVTNCSFSGNSGSGRATAIQLQRGEMYRCAITNHGGTYAVDTLYATTIRNTLFAGNAGRGIRNWGGGVMDNCTITDNRYGIDRQAGNTLVLRNSIVYGNTTADFINSALVIRMTNSCSSDISFPGENNTASDPLFANPDTANYHLAGRSPCRDTGLALSWMTEDSTDLDGNPRVVGVVDMGVYELPPPQGTVVILR